MPSPHHLYPPYFTYTRDFDCHVQEEKKGRELRREGDKLKRGEKVGGGGGRGGSLVKKTHIGRRNNVGFSLPCPRSSHCEFSKMGGREDKEWRRGSRKEGGRGEIRYEEG